ncbi:MAG: hypothetical protein WB791_11100 [Waddliaceae bacterium]
MGKAKTLIDPIEYKENFLNVVFDKAPKLPQGSQQLEELTGENLYSLSTFVDLINNERGWALEILLDFL